MSKIKSPHYCTCCGTRYDTAVMCPNCKKYDAARTAKLDPPGDPSTIRAAKLCVPCVSVDFVVEDGGGGYQMDLYVDGKLQMISCRDFGGDATSAELRASLLEELTKAMKRWREKN